MKSLYLSVNFLLFLSIPLAPQATGAAFERLGINIHSEWTPFLVFALTIIEVICFAWLIFQMRLIKQPKQFVTMSSVSKKVFHSGKWQTIEQFLETSYNLEISHGMTPEEGQAWLLEGEAYLAGRSGIEENAKNHS